MRTLAIVALAVLWATSGPRSQTLPPLYEYRARTYGPADGLRSAFVHRLHVGDDGAPLVLNARGVVRLRGAGFEPVPMSGFDGPPTRLWGGAPGRLWVTTREGEVGVLDGDRFRRVWTAGGQSVEATTSSGAVWARGDGELTRVRLDGAVPRVDRFSGADGVPSGAALVFDLDDGRRLGEGSRTVAWVRELPGGGVRVVTVRSPRCPSGGELGTFTDAAGLWITGAGAVCYVEDGRAVRVDPDTLTLDSFAWADATRLEFNPLAPNPGMPGHLLDAAARSLDDPDLLEGRGVTRVLASRGAGGRTTFWVVLEDAADGAGTLVRLRDGRATVVPVHGELGSHRITDVVRDPEGSVWVGTDKGLVQLVPRRTPVLPPGPHLAEGFTTAVVQTRDGAVWVGTWGGGLHRYDGGRLTHRLTTADGLPSAMVRSLHEARDGALWVGTSLGAVRVRGGRVVGPTVHGGGGHEVRGFAEDPDGALWIASEAGVYRRDPGGAIARVGGRRLRAAWAVHRARSGALLVGTERGLFDVRGGRVRAFGVPDAPQFVVTVHEEADGTLWFGTFRGGLQRHRPGRHGPARFAAVTTAEGLHSDGVWRVLDDGRGYYWLSSDDGVARVSREALHEVADAVEAGRPADPLRPLLFTEAEGMLSRECNRAGPGGWRLADGRLVFNNLRGLVVVDPVRATRPPPAPAVVFHGATADGRPVALGEGRGEVRLPAGVRHVEFDFDALSFVAPRQNRYRYRLDGYDDGWVDGGGRSRATYTGLPPGRYTLRVQGASGLSGWGAPGASLAVVVPPLAWQTWWFRLLVAAAVVGLVVAAYRYRVRRLLEVERLRLRIAADLHDDIGSTLSSIALASEMLQSGALGHGDDVERRQIGRIRAAAEETIGALRDVIWLVDPEHDDLDGLVRRMRKTAADLLDGTPYTFGATGIENRPLGMDFLRHVFLLYKEALHNVASHAAADHVAVAVAVDQGQLVLTVSDDGVGFRADEVRRGHGLESMRRRAEQIDGHVEVDSTPGTGTRVTFSARMV